MKNVSDSDNRPTKLNGVQCSVHVKLSRLTQSLEPRRLAHQLLAEVFGVVQGGSADELL